MFCIQYLFKKKWEQNCPHLYNKTQKNYAPVGSICVDDASSVTTDGVMKYGGFVS